MIEIRNYMYECFCNKYKVRHFYNPFTCEINNNFYSKICKYFFDYNFCKNDYCHYKHLKDIELPVENDIADTLIESGEIGWKIKKPSYDVMESSKESYDPINKKPKLYQKQQRYVGHYHNKYRPKKEMIQIENKLWICSKDNQCKIATIM